MVFRSGRVESCREKATPVSFAPKRRKVCPLEIARKELSSCGLQKNGLSIYCALILLRTVACVTKLFGGTSSVSQTFPPIVDPRPTMIRPRIVAPA